MRFRSAVDRIFAQLQHCGRVSHPSMLPNDATPVAPTAIRPAGKPVTYSGTAPKLPRRHEGGGMQEVS